MFPKIGPRPIAEIDSPQMLSIVREVKARGVRETAKRILQRSHAVFQDGIMTGRCSRNPAADIDAQTVLKKGPGVHSTWPASRRRRFRSSCETSTLTKAT